MIQRDELCRAGGGQQIFYNNVYNNNKPILYCIQYERLTVREYCITIGGGRIDIRFIIIVIYDY